MNGRTDHLNAKGEQASGAALLQNPNRAGKVIPPVGTNNEQRTTRQKMRDELLNHVNHDDVCTVAIGVVGLLLNELVKNPSDCKVEAKPQGLTFFHIDVTANANVYKFINGSGGANFKGFEAACAILSKRSPVEVLFHLNDSGGERKREENEPADPNWDRIGVEQMFRAVFDALLEGQCVVSVSDDRDLRSGKTKVEVLIPGAIEDETVNLLNQMFDMVRQIGFSHRRPWMKLKVIRDQALYERVGGPTLEHAESSWDPKSWKK